MKSAKVIFTKEEAVLLRLELKNSKKSYSRDLKIILSVISLGSVSLFIGFDSEMITELIKSVTGFSIFFLCTFLYIFPKSIQKLEIDVKNGEKTVAEAKIISFGFFSKKVILANGFKMDKGEVARLDWKIGDTVKYECTPVANYFLKTELLSNNRNL